MTRDKVRTSIKRMLLSCANSLCFVINKKSQLGDMIIHHSSNLVMTNSFLVPPPSSLGRQGPSTNTNKADQKERR